MPSKPASFDVVAEENFQAFADHFVRREDRRVRAVLTNGRVLEGRLVALRGRVVHIWTDAPTPLPPPWRRRGRELIELPVARVRRLVVRRPRRGRQAVVALGVSALASLLGAFVPLGPLDLWYGYIGLGAVFGLLVGVLAAFALDSAPWIAPWQDLYVPGDT